MSPPTPVPQDLSPLTSEFADNEYKHVEPPPLSLNAAQETPQPQIPGLNTLPPSQKVQVEAAPYVRSPQYNAEIPHAHTPIDGLAAPEAPPIERSLGSEKQELSSLHGGQDGMEVEAAPRVDKPLMDAEIPHDHNPVEGLQAPEVPPEERRLDRKSEDDVVRFEDGDEDLHGTYERAR